MPHRVVGLIPARAGSKRIPRKNVRLVGSHPLIAYSIAAARHSGAFDTVMVSTESQSIAHIAVHYGADVPFLRPAEMAADLSPDIDWVRFTIKQLASVGREFDAFAILRPTSPLRRGTTIAVAVEMLLADSNADSVRAVEPCAQHPGKMWVIDDAYMRPLLNDNGAQPPWHSRPYQALPPVYAQNASLEVAWTSVITEKDSIAGDAVLPLITDGFDGFDLNVREDWWVLERILSEGLAELPHVGVAPYEFRDEGEER